MVAAWRTEPNGFPNQQPSFQQQPFQQQISPQYNQDTFRSRATQPDPRRRATAGWPANGSSYGYLQGQNTVVPQTGYNPVQQQLQNNPGYIPQFDPYASIGQGWDGQAAPQPQVQPSNPMQSPASPGALATSTSTSPTGQSHPREYIRTHKAEVESWDTYAWKQLLNGFDVLKEAWEARKTEIDGHVAQLQQQVQYGGYYAAQVQQEAARLQGMAKEAALNFDSVAASSFQMHEVFANYRQSGDLASKRRVREASNAAIQSLPDWPPLTY
ncbi:hypothetical protein B0H10DRAFT_1946558 [Mycena sp. CBHHK59/15]|nr:hypothetical protein B0H10DRAFT_1946558 [Mycena sp. CBHHK59/15]